MLGRLNLVFILVTFLSIQEIHSHKVRDCGCGQFQRTREKGLRNLVYFLLEENKACHRALEKQNTIPKDCKQCYKNGIRKNGVYTIKPEGAKVSFQVYCDMYNGGWTVIQRRMNGAVSFDHGWKKYASGFGELKADHWLGLNYIHLLTKSPKRISFEFKMTSTKKMATAVYEGFQVDNETANFIMHVSPKVILNVEMSKYLAGRRGFYYHNGAQFSTKDRDNDNYKKGKCTKLYPGAWWYNDCYRIAELHGNFKNMRFAAGSYKPVSTSEIKIY